MKEYKLKKGVFFNMSVFLIGSFVFLGLLLSQLLDDFELIKDYAFLVGLILFTILFGIYDFITILYLKEDIGKKVMINTQTKELCIKKSNKVWNVKKSDIQQCYIVESRRNWNSQDPFRVHKYAAISLKSGKLLVVTNLIVEPKGILNLLGWNYKLLEQTFPNIDYKIGSGILTEENFEKKVMEFYNAFSNKTSEELLQICNKPDVYANYAIESARRLLKEMK